MKYLFLIFALSFGFISCNQNEILTDSTSTEIEEVQVVRKQSKAGVLYTIYVNFSQGSCTMSNKARVKLHNQLDNIKAQHPNMALLQVTGNAWEWTLPDGTFICQCRADNVLSYFNRWASTAGVGQSFGITTCVNHIHSGPENQQVILEIDAFL